MWLRELNTFEVKAIFYSHVNHSIKLASNNTKTLIDLFFFFFFVFFRATPTAYGGFQAMGPIGAVAAGLRQSHSKARSKPSLRPTPQLTATLGP